MKKIMLIVISAGFFMACKKENDTIQHTVSFASNIDNSQYYRITINNTSGNNITTSYKVDSDSDVELKLFAAGGDTTSIDSRDSLWVRGGITVDGILVSSFAGYRDAILSYHIE
jgi:hypothetical protein